MRKRKWPFRSGELVHIQRCEEQIGVVSAPASLEAFCDRYGNGTYIVHSAKKKLTLKISK